MFALRNSKILRSIEEVATNWPFVSSSVACSSTGMQSSMLAADFFDGCGLLVV